MLRGARQALIVGHAEWLLNATDAPILIVLDKINESNVRSAWDEAKLHAAAGRDDEAIAALKRIRAVPKVEAGFLARLGEEAVRTRVLPRLFIHGLPEDDVLLYLPDGHGLVKKKKAQDLDLADVKVAVGKLDGIHSDLTDLLTEIKRLAAAFGGPLTF